MSKKLRDAFVTLVDSPPVACKLDPSDRWNGFACPYFTREQLPALLDMINDGDMVATLTDDDAVRVAYVEGDDPEIITPVEIDGVQMWPVGAWSWTWQLEEGILTSVECPGCGQRIYLRDDGSTECGGRDEGTCMAANYAHDVARGIAPEWEADDCEPPSRGDCEDILTAHRMVSDGEAR